MGKSKTKKSGPFDPKDFSPEEQLKFEIAQELWAGRKSDGEWLEEPDSKGKRKDRRTYHQKKEGDEGRGIESRGKLSYT